MGGDQVGRREGGGHRNRCSDRGPQNRGEKRGNRDGERGKGWTGREEEGR